MGVNAGGDPIPGDVTSGGDLRPEGDLVADGISVERSGRMLLRDVDLRVAPGELVALVGPNGAGKSTLLACLAGDLHPHRGEVRLDERSVRRWPTRELARRRAVLLQDVEVSFPFTARQVVAMGRDPWRGTPASERDEAAIDDALADTDALDLADRAVPTLSGGERARVALARVLAQDTRLVLLDEPTAALDLGHQEDVMGTVRARSLAGRAVVVVLHDLALAAAYADRMVVLHGGRVVADGPPADVLRPGLVEAVYGRAVDVVEVVPGSPVVVPHRVFGLPTF
jgi:iron complex transport system ATP-binding protein